MYDDLPGLIPSGIFPMSAKVLLHPSEQGPWSVSLSDKIDKQQKMGICIFDYMVSLSVDTNDAYFIVIAMPSFYAAVHAGNP